MSCSKDPGTTHYTGCYCYEEARNAQIAKLESQVKRYREALEEIAWLAGDYGSEHVGIAREALKEDA